MFFPTLGELASRRVIQIDINASLQDAVKKMHEHNHRTIVVTHTNAYYVLTTADILALQFQEIDFSIPLTQCPLKPVPVIKKNENILAALNSINQEHEYLCVSDDDDTLYGLVTNSDIIASIDPQIMLENVNLRTVMTKRYSFEMVDARTSMHAALKQMHQCESDCIIVTESDMPVGIVTAKDILRYINVYPNKNPGDGLVSDFMATPLKTVNESSSISDALEFIRTEHFKRIVVSDDNGKVVGIISQKELISQTYLRWSKLLKAHCSELEELSTLLESENRQLMQLATRDRLTQLNNRHMFEEMFNKKLFYARRYETEICLILADIDYFKRINDTYGHNIGDYVLKEFALLMNSYIRSSDLLARWGGEEFIILLPHTSAIEALQMAEKTRMRIAEHRFETVGNITCSFGIAELNYEDTIERIVERADQALYKAKTLGRNCSYIYED